MSNWMRSGPSVAGHEIFYLSACLYPGGGTQPVDFGWMLRWVSMQSLQSVSGRKGINSEAEERGLQIRLYERTC